MVRGNRCALMTSNRNCHQSIQGEYQFNVKMSCEGCSGAVNRALAKVEGITYEVKLKEQQVNVKGDVPYDTILEKIKKTGKEVGASSSHLFEARCWRHKSIGWPPHLVCRT
ncbi:hypothetical protein PAXRUDRAFT_398535 [Paxillus rubicundulus Ve08.2h10]|uniref:HMA domain-containing protein n=2 Tax=Paxillus TaxID=5395 RepID=A0A0D0DD86_9AGAM|nr:hypothetical protein PAXRUDRAFT_398535 [Paxillus rubicundulus Ve08.2h10]